MSIIVFHLFHYVERPTTTIIIKYAVKQINRIHIIFFPNLILLKTIQLQKQLKNDCMLNMQLYKRYVPPG
jgi:hypothetical protein